MVVHRHELGEVENECTSYNFRQFAIFVPTIITAALKTRSIESRTSHGKFISRELTTLVEICRSYNKNNFVCFFLIHGVWTKT